MVDSEAPARSDDGSPPDPGSAPVVDAAPRSLVALALVVTAVGVALRFVASSPLWLDEALSVNIASLPLGEISDALRHDGHPPAYYVLLHQWMDLFGTSDAWARALSGLWGVLLLPLVWVAGRRLGGPALGWCALALVASSPYAIRYSTEARMYAMVAVLAVAGWLLAQDALRRPTWWRLLGLVLLSGLALWTHYWTLWLLGGAAASLAVRWWRDGRTGDREAQTRTVKVLAALATGGILFLPWVPTLLYQGAHTGTPWARPMRPTEIVSYTAGAFGGGTLPEALLLGWLLVGLAVVGSLGRHDGPGRITLTLRTRPVARPLVIIVAATFGLGCLAGYVAETTYQPRYASVVFGFFVLLVALGVRTLASGPSGMVVLAALCTLGVGVTVLNLREDRSDAARSAEAISAVAEPGDLVVYCPDQLGPSTSRRLGDDLRQVTFPDMAAPERVDWVDYQERLDRASVEDFADRLVEEAGTGAVFLVLSSEYSTHRELCPALMDALGARRPGEVLSTQTPAYEPSTVVVYRPG